jgi:MFS superfamily sulfate permease-like transporter
MPSMAEAAPVVREPVVGRLEGHLTRAQLEQVLSDIAEQLRTRGSAPVLLDCSAMDGYDLDARHAFVEWNKQWKTHVTRVAIVTSNRLYHVVIATMSLASGQAMKGFAQREDALAWAQASV